MDTLENAAGVRQGPAPFSDSIDCQFMELLYSLQFLKLTYDKQKKKRKKRKEKKQIIPCVPISNN